MFSVKKPQTHPAGNVKSEPIDWAWVIYIGMNKLGYTETEIKHMYWGKWFDLFGTYKKQYNFEKNKKMYALAEKKQIVSLSGL